jgi:GxGYxY sequence motif in domain of unknown function N-terminal/GxGYxYP putative glycoside hydrolase C-terminal domain/Secretion system C-terminal sorting domain
MKIKSIRRIVVFLFLISVFLPLGKAKAQSGIDYLPQTPACSDTAFSFVYEGVSQGFRLAAVSLQGLVNRDTARIYLRERNSSWLLDFYKEQGTVKSEITYDNIYNLLKRFKNYFKGAVIIDPAKSYTVNLASNIAGVEDRVIISPDMITLFKRHLGSTIDIKDLRTYNFTDQLSAYTWYEQNILPLQPKTVLAVAKDFFMHDVYRDYLVQFKIPTFWLPGPSDSDYSQAYENKIKNLFLNTPPNIPVLGFWPATDANGKNYGYEEYAGVKLAGYYGKFSLVNTWVGNYSFHSALKNAPDTYKQVKVRSKKFREYDPSKKYIALIMIESGDSPAYLQYGINQRQWSDPYRGQVPISYGITPSIRFLLPGLAKYLYETATENDFFFCSISGAGYCYPFEGFCDLTSDPARYKKEYFDMTAANMQLLDMDMMGLYSHPGSKWTTADMRIAKTYIQPMKGLKSVIAEMNRVGYTAANSSEIMDSVTIHHNLTFWPMVDYKWDDPSQDSVAVNFMEKEIKTYGTGGNFIESMFYSWMYGPRRLKMLMDRMEKQGYEFVTLNEFDYLCRVAKGWKQITDIQTSIQKMPSGSVNCFPNPTSGVLNFSQPISGIIHCYDTIGRLVQSLDVKNALQLDLTSLGKGVFYLQTRDRANSILSFKVVII